jgi:hypothetical protein
MRSQAVVLTYPGHFLLTKLTIDSIQKHISGIKNIVVIVDDLSLLAWTGYIDDCAKLYQTNIVTTSQLQIQNLREFRKNPWVKQQIIKLYLDLIFPTKSEVFFADGDVVFHHDVEYQGVPYFVRTQGHEFTLTKKYIQDILGHEFSGLQVDDRTVCANGAPFRDIQLDILPQLRNTIETHTQKPFIDYHLALMTDNTQAVSEWELLEFYKKTILNVDSDFYYYHLQYIDQVLTKDPGRYFSSCFCCDKQLGKNWWLEQQLDVDQYWSRLPNKKYN